MAKEGKKKNIVQDVIPPRRSVRDIELPSKPKRLEEELAPNIKKPSPSYEYVESKKSKKKGLYIAIAFLILVGVLAISALFKSAEIRLTPKQEAKTLNETFTVKKDAVSGLTFQIVTVSKNMEKTVDATSEQQVLKKARGRIVIYNNYNAQTQKLVATTRFQTPESLIFRLLEGVTVPGKQTKDGKTVAGSVEVTVEADKPGSTYNIQLKDFTIPGFRGDPKYTEIYARSKTVMSGGFSGQQKIVSKEVLSQTDKELETSLKDSLVKDIVSQIPANFVLYTNSLSYQFKPVTQVVGNENAESPSTAGGSVLLRKHGVTSAIIFDKGQLSRTIIAKVLPDIGDNIVKITNLETLNFAYDPGIQFDPNINSSITFNLKGVANFVWVFDENKLKSDLLGLSKKNAKSIISTYGSIKEAWVTTRPFWNQTIPTDPKKVTLINTLTN